MLQVFLQTKIELEWWKHTVNIPHGVTCRTWTVIHYIILLTFSHSWMYLEKFSYSATLSQNEAGFIGSHVNA